MNALLTLLGLGFLVIFGAVGGVIWILKSFIAPRNRGLSRDWIDGYRQGQMDAQDGVHVNYMPR